MSTAACRKAIYCFEGEQAVLSLLRWRMEHSDPNLAWPGVVNDCKDTKKSQCAQLVVTD